MLIRVGAGRRFAAFAIDVVVCAALIVAVFGLRLVAQSPTIAQTHPAVRMVVPTDLDGRFREQLRRFEAVLETDPVFRPALSDEQISAFARILSRELPLMLSDIADAPAGRPAAIAGDLDAFVGEAFVRVRAAADPRLPESAIAGLEAAMRRFLAEFSPVDVVWLLLPFFITAIVIGCAVVLAYYLSEALVGVSLGKAIVGIRVGAANGDRAAFPLLLVRYLFKNVGFVLAIVAAVTAVWSLAAVAVGAHVVISVGHLAVVAAPKRGLHDLFAGTAVYARRDLR